MAPAHGHQQKIAPPNRLIHEKSPYLLQHAHNPVDWYPWCDEAFEKARSEEKPIFLSIGFSACHRCHVMERESFEDPQVAKLLNEVFVSVKVDREERPDIDQIYMAAAEVLTGGGGWPLTVFMTPDRKPFFAASYVPKESRYGMTGLLDLIPRIRKAWVSQRHELEDAGSRVMQALRRAAEGSPGEALDERTLDAAYDALFRRFDGEHGGFGDAPKFPTPHHLLFLMRYGKRTGKAPAFAMVEKTLRAMRRGGIYDHIGFGFHRYSTDAEWFVPHFEKMLYDQALLTMAYTEAFVATGEEEFKRTAEEIVAYVLRDTTGPEGGFCAAEDADSEGEEGKFYLWTKEEILRVLGEEEGERFSAIFDVREAGNVRREETGEWAGRNILRQRRPLEAWASEFGVSADELERFVASARQKLYAARERRVHPARDDAFLTDWNALMIAALARAARAFDRAEYLEAAERAASFILSTLRGPDGRLLHCYRDGEAAFPATADDYVFMLWALLELYEASFNVDHIRTAIGLVRDLIAHYWACATGGFYFTPDDADVPVRQKIVRDGATPSANSAAMLNLFIFGRLTANLEFEEMAQRIGRVFAGTVRSAPAAHTFLMAALNFMLGPSYEVIIAGVPGADDTNAMLRALRSHYTPNAVILFRPTDVESPEITSVAGFTQNSIALEDRATAYVCTNYACDIPTTDVGEMLRLLGKKGTEGPIP